jgi:hypothetical protein
LFSTNALSVADCFAVMSNWPVSYSSVATSTPPTLPGGLSLSTTEVTVNNYTVWINNSTGVTLKFKVGSIISTKQNCPITAVSVPTGTTGQFSGIEVSKNIDFTVVLYGWQ